MQTQTGNKMKVLRSDKGREYTSEEFRKYTKERGVIHEFSSPYIHEQNGRAEREIRTIVESARSMLFSKSIDVKLWTEAVNTACYVLNRVILQHHETETPFEKWFNRKPEIKYLRVFGTEAYINVPKEKRKKFEPKSKKITVVGYDGDSSNYRLWYKKTRKIYISSDVDSNENSSNYNKNNENCNFHFGIEEDPEIKEDRKIQDHQGANQQVADQEIQDRQIANQEIQDRQIADQEIQDHQIADQNAPPDRYGFSVAYVADTIPVTFGEAMSSPEADKWRSAIKEKINAFEESTWSLNKLPLVKRAIGCKWVFAIKTNSHQNSHRYKARLVAKGFSQREGIDYFETFSPVVRYEFIRILLALAAKEDYEIIKFDVKTAFLNGDLQEDLYMELPERYANEENRDSICKLRRSLYEKFIELVLKCTWRYMSMMA